MGFLEKADTNRLNKQNEMKLKRYRIVRDGFLGYEVQVWRLWLPFWIQCFWTNTSSSIEDAKGVIERHRNKVVHKD